MKKSFLPEKCTTNLLSEHLMEFYASNNHTCYWLVVDKNHVFSLFESSNIWLRIGDLKDETCDGRIVERHKLSRLEALIWGMYEERQFACMSPWEVLEVSFEQFKKGIIHEEIS